MHQHREYKRPTRCFRMSSLSLINPCSRHVAYKMVVLLWSRGGFQSLSISPVQYCCPECDGLVARQLL
jgi:hypothetical protein